MTENNITIYWGNRAQYDRHAVALDIQDACNIRAIARELVKMTDKAADELSYPIEDDAAVVLLINKLESLVRSEDRFHAAYGVCMEKTGRA